MKTLSVLAIMATFAIVLSACGDSASDGSSSDADPALVAAIASEIKGDPDDGFELADRDATCIAEKAVVGIGLDRLAELGVTADDVGEIDQVGFTDSEIGTIVSGFTDCVDLGELMAQSLVADGTVSADDAECVADKFDADLIERLLASTFSGEDLQSSAVGEDLFEAIFGIFVECDISF